MYNPNKVIQLLRERGIKGRELLLYLGIPTHGSVLARVGADIRVSKLEKIADFFNVPIDTFFDRKQTTGGVQVSGTSNHVHHFEVGTTKVQNDYLQELIEEKDKRIAALEELLSVYKKQVDGI